MGINEQKFAEDPARLTENELQEITGGAEAPDPTPVADPGVIQRAKDALGKPYQWGGVGPEGYDCSGLVSYCLTGAHMRLGTPGTFMGWPRTADPRPGDICVSPSHCGIYVAKGQMIHAPGPGQAVCAGGIPADMIFVRRP